MDPLTIYSLATSTASALLVIGLIIQSSVTWAQAYNDAPTELITLIDEVSSTRAALKPLEVYVREGDVEQQSREVIIAMMDKLKAMEDRLYDQLDMHLGKVTASIGKASM